MGAAGVAVGAVVGAGAGALLVGASVFGLCKLMGGGNAGGLGLKMELLGLAVGRDTGYASLALKLMQPGAKMLEILTGSTLFRFQIAVSICCLVSKETMALHFLPGQLSPASPFLTT